MPTFLASLKQEHEHSFHFYVQTILIKATRSRLVSLSQYLMLLRCWLRGDLHYWLEADAPRQGRFTQGCSPHLPFWHLRDWVFCRSISLLYIQRVRPKKSGANDITFISSIINNTTQVFMKIDGSFWHNNFTLNMKAYVSIAVHTSYRVTNYKVGGKYTSTCMCPDKGATGSRISFIFSG